MKLTHPDSDLTVEPKAEHVAEYQSQGWAKVAAPITPKSDESPGN